MVERIKDNEYKKNAIIKKTLSGCVISLLPFMTIAILGTLEIYSGNYEQLEFGIGDFWGEIVFASTICSLIGGLCSLIPIVGDIILSLLFWLGIASYLQILFFNKYIGIINGTDTSVDGNYDLQIFNLAWVIFFCMIAILVIRVKRYRTVLLYASSFLVLIQLVAVISIVLTRGITFADEKVYALDWGNVYDLGDTNIIVLCLDSYSNKDFEEFLMDSPENQEDYKDFTYYNNACSVYGATFPSLLHMITGEAPTYKGSCRKWKNESWNSDRCKEFYENMHNAGFVCGLYTVNDVGILGNLENAKDDFDNICLKNVSIEKDRLIHVMIQLALYRAAPYRFKGRFVILSDPFASCLHMDNDTTLYENSRFYDGLVGHGIKKTEKKKYSFIHIKGLHQPYNLDGYGNYTEEASLIETREGIGVIIKEYLQQLKDLNIYENSTVIITADHGSTLLLSDDMKNQPVFLYKEANATKEKMELCCAPISHDDIPATILNAAGIQCDGFGKAVTEWKADDSRERMQEERSTGIFYHFIGDRDDLWDCKTSGQGIQCAVPNDWR